MQRILRQIARRVNPTPQPSCAPLPLPHLKHLPHPPHHRSSARLMRARMHRIPRLIAQRSKSTSQPPCAPPPLRHLKHLPHLPEKHRSTNPLWPTPTPCRLRLNHPLGSNPNGLQPPAFSARQTSRHPSQASLLRLLHSLQAVHKGYNLWPRTPAPPGMGPPRPLYPARTRGHCHWFMRLRANRKALRSSPKRILVRIWSAGAQTTT